MIKEQPPELSHIYYKLLDIYGTLCDEQRPELKRTVELLREAIKEFYFVIEVEIEDFILEERFK